MAYWVSGPRYFYEGLYSLTILSAAGIAWLAGWLPEQAHLSARQARLRGGIVLAVCAGLIVLGTIPYTPSRLYEIKGRYGFSQADLEPFDTPEAQELPPALVIIHAAAWWDYGVYLHLQDPYLTSPFIFVWASPTNDPSAAVSPHFPDRSIYHYYPDQPGEFYTQSRP